MIKPRNHDGHVMITRGEMGKDLGVAYRKFSCFKNIKVSFAFGCD